jgi:hypothetical protein
MALAYPGPEFNPQNRKSIKFSKLALNKNKCKDINN